MGKYRDNLKEAMDLLAKDPRTVFVGQAVEYIGTGQTPSFKDIPEDKKFEMPVAEDMQMGLSIGLALAGKIPITVYPRFDFLLCAANQLVTHWDKIFYRYGKMIIRVAVGGVDPMDPGPQHRGDYTEAFRHLLKNVEIVTLPKEQTDNIVEEYRYALTKSIGKKSTLIIEYGDLYGT